MQVMRRKYKSMIWVKIQVKVFDEIFADKIDGKDNWDLSDSTQQETRELSNSVAHARNWRHDAHGPWREREVIIDFETIEVWIWRALVAQ